MASKYELCKIEMIDKIMKEFEAGKLKSSSKNKVKSKSQALAIGISMGDSKCKKHIDNIYLERLKKKVNRFLFKNEKIKRDKISYSGVIDVIKYIDLKNKNIYKKHLLDRFLLSIEFNDHNLNKKISKIIYNM